MQVNRLVEIIGADFYTGIPDSQLKALCNYLIDEYGIEPKHHMIAANEGNAVALAAGYHLATGKIPVVYMQNSGEGNIINPVASLLNDKVYAIPSIFIIGWRGEPGVRDEPQHIYQGEITLKLLEDMGIEYSIIDPKTTVDELKEVMNRFNVILENGKQVAFVIKKGGLIYERDIAYKNNYTLLREEIIRNIIEVSDEDLVVSTTGKASRELFEVRVEKGQSHKYDFLTVGSMGHSSSIALSIALQKKDKKIWIIDGDGAILMHMGSMALIGANSPQNVVHIVINNGSHETVGGMPTVAEKIDLLCIAKGCGYTQYLCVDNEVDLKEALLEAKKANELFFIEVKSAIGARKNLGRPTTSPIENKKEFMQYVAEI